MRDFIVVQCIVTQEKYNIPKEGLDEEIVQGLLRGEIAYLSQEARDRGWGFMTQLTETELLEYREVKEVGGDILMRHLRWFLNPADPDDTRMRK